MAKNEITGCLHKQNYKLKDLYSICSTCGILMTGRNVNKR